jgi:methylmalonyl-CoA/ethylmalonyl-CoA epimerase
MDLPENATDELREVPGIEGIDHLAIAVPQGQLEEQLAAYALLGLREVHREEMRAGDMVRESMLSIGGGSYLQLLEPLSPESPVQTLLDRNRGRPCFAHIAFRVQSAQRAFEAMRAAQFCMVDEAPRKGSRGSTVFFVHPKSRPGGGFGYLIEIVEPAR